MKLPASRKAGRMVAAARRLTEALVALAYSRMVMARGAIIPSVPAVPCSAAQKSAR